MNTTPNSNELFISKLLPDRSDSIGKGRLNGVLHLPTADLNLNHTNWQLPKCAITSTLKEKSLMNSLLENRSEVREPLPKLRLFIGKKQPISGPVKQPNDENLNIVAGNRKNYISIEKPQARRCSLEPSTNRRQASRSVRLSRRLAPIRTSVLEKCDGM